MNTAPALPRLHTPCPSATGRCTSLHAFCTTPYLIRIHLQGWRAIDRAYYDKGFNDQPWFRVRETFLKKEKYEVSPQPRKSLVKSEL